MIPVVTPAEMRELDAAAPEPVEVLIERAGAAVAREAVRLMGGTYGRTVTVVTGPGNNGADGRVAAERLHERGVRVRVVEALDRLTALPTADLIIDAAFGSGFRDDWVMPDVGGAPILAVDVPTGLDGTTGQAADATRRADVTVTFAAARPGHVLGRGPELVGRLCVADIGLRLGVLATGIVEASDVARWLPTRGRSDHKWADAVRIVAGSPGMTGAAHLATAAAFRAGSGMVVVSAPGIDADVPIEAVDRRIPPFDWAGHVLGNLHRFHALVVGPGLGRDEATIPSVVATVVDAVVPVVVDGDGLFALSWNDAGNPGFLREREVPTVLTPHDGEYGRLMGHSPGADRLAAAHDLAAMTGAVVLLKGPTTVVASPDGRALLVTNGTERLATAGTGDVLSGIIGALLAQGVPAFAAAASGAWLLGAAGELAAAGMVARDLIGTIPLAIDRARST